MKAVGIIRLGDPDVVQVIDAADPSCGPSEVMIRPEATSYNHLDALLRQEDFGLDFPVVPAATLSGMSLAKAASWSVDAYSLIQQSHAGSVIDASQAINAATYRYWASIEAVDTGNLSSYLQASAWKRLTHSHRKSWVVFLSYSSLPGECSSHGHD